MTEPTPITPAQVKTVVQKEMKKSDFSWIRRDWLVIGCLFAILSVLSITTIMSINRVEQAVKEAEVISECFTPNTRCYNFAEENRKQERAFLVDLISRSNRCLLESNVPGLNQEQRITAYDECINRLPDE